MGVSLFVWKSFKIIYIKNQIIELNFGYIQKITTKSILIIEMVTLVSYNYIKKTFHKLSLLQISPNNDKNTTKILKILVLINRKHYNI